MTKQDATKIIYEVDGRDRKWMEAWGKSTILEAVRIIQSRKSSNQQERLDAEKVHYLLTRNY